MRKAFKWLRMILLCIPRVFFDYLTYILPYSRHPERYPLQKRYKKVRKTIVFVLKKARINAFIDESVSLPLQTKGCLVVGNHLSFLDPLLLVAMSEQPIAFVAKKEAKKLPFVGRLIRILGGTFIDRADPLDTLRKFRTVAKVIQQENMAYAIFPEGTRNKFPYGMMNEFHPGALKLSTMAQLDVMPVCFFGEQRILEEKKIYRNYPVQFTTLPVVPKEKIAEMGTTEAATYLYKMIDGPLQKMIDFDRHYMEEGKTKFRPVKWWKKPKEEPQEEGEKDDKNNG